MKSRYGILAAALSLTSIAGTAGYGQVTVKHIQTEKSPIATAVWAGDTLYVSGQLANPVTPADAAKGTPADYGDTKTQTASILNKVQAILKEQGSGYEGRGEVHGVPGSRSEAGQD